MVRSALRSPVRPLAEGDMGSGVVTVRRRVGETFELKVFQSDPERKPLTLERACCIPIVMLEPRVVLPPTVPLIETGLVPVTVVTFTALAARSVVRLATSDSCKANIVRRFAMLRLRIFPVVPALLPRTVKGGAVTSMALVTRLFPMVVEVPPAVVLTSPLKAGIRVVGRGEVLKEADPAEAVALPYQERAGVSVAREKAMVALLLGDVTEVVKRGERVC